MSETSSTAKLSAGRPQDDRVTDALFQATLKELSSHGLEGTTLSAIAARARTSKQAVYRRFTDKSELIATSVESGLVKINVMSPRRGSVAADLRQFLSGTVRALQDTDLGGAIRAIVSSRDVPALAKVLAEAEAGQRLVLRQIFIATSFEADMETRIDLLLGFIYFRLLIRDQIVTETDIETAVYLVLGLVAPRDPAPNEGLPGM
ncbi:MAG: TetR/AcrR family transcriptional regulator [Roseibium sp.]|uniref:TetR/AcrR family transcriptional regulator n=1 Tax=Roseibium sp. TaxID=1936156 RepID=UPI0026123EB4|nr:TetR/AcrR family transcriptional regulator [Roseibium sp.]MCV0427768.1 TetR/AcrR family transcriptional regulator [Roseibium sp.]